MTALATLYLFPEIIFNAELVRTAGSAASNYDELRRLELFGRAVSGIGVSLLLLDAFAIFPLRSKAKTLLVAALVVVFVWPIVFFGQKLLIDYFFIDDSTAEQRQMAFLSVLVKNSLAAQAVEVDGLPFDSKQPDEPVSQTFLSLFGGLVYANSDVLDQIKQSKREIATAYIVNQTHADIEHYLDQHHQLSVKLKDVYHNKYQPAYEAYKKSILESNNIADTEWERVQKRLDSSWNDYKKLAQQADKLASKQAEQVAPKIYQFLEYYYGKCVNNRTVDQRCRNRVEERYAKEIKLLGYGHIPHDYWLIAEDVSTSENLFNSLVTGIVTGGLSVVVQTLDAVTGGDGGFKDKEYHYTNNEAHYKQRIAALPSFSQKFIDDYGYPPTLGNRELFLAYPETTVRTIKLLENEGINLPETWKLNERDVFNHAVIERITRLATKRWSIAFDSYAIELPPGLTWYEFHQNDQVLVYINRQLSRIQLKSYDPDWNDNEFTRWVLEPEVSKQVDELLLKLSAEEKAFSDGGVMASEGKQSLRAVIIPPISMALSLLLICLTVIKLPQRYLQLAAGEPDKTLRTLYRLVPILTLGVVIMIPLYVLQPNFRQDYPGAESFLNALENTSNPIVAGAVEWTLKTQPLISPIGNQLAGAVDFENQSTPLIELLEQVDRLGVKTSNSAR